MTGQAEALDRLSPAEQAREESLVRLDRYERGLLSGVTAAWTAASLALGALMDLLMHPAMSGEGVVLMASAFLGLLSPAAVGAVRNVKARVSGMRLALESADGSTRGHLSPRLRGLLVETRMVYSVLQGDAEAGMTRRAVWDWLRGLDALDGEDRMVLREAGLDGENVRLVFAGGDEEARLDRRARRQLARSFKFFADGLERASADPYR